MEIAGIVRRWVELNRPRIEANGFALKFEQISGDASAIMDLESEDVLARIYIYDTGLISCDAGTIRESIDLEAPVDDSRSISENLDAVRDFLLSQK